MGLFELPFHSAIGGAETVLLAGAGGGFDIFTGLPLYFALREAGKQVHLANFSFTDFSLTTAERLAPALVRVDADTKGIDRYFPELHLSRWFRARGEEVPVYCFDRVGVMPLMNAYATLALRLTPDTLVLVDGGTDSLMRGDEVDLGTPHEDIASIAAVDMLDVPNKLLVCVGFGVDTYHGICHAQFLEAVAEIIQAGGFLGAWSLMREMPEVQLYREACDYVFERMSDHPSIVSSSVLSAIEGRFGDYHATERTKGSSLFINPLMSLYWAFQLEPVARRILYLEDLYETRTHGDVHRAIVMFRAHCRNIKPWRNLPM